MTEPLCGSENFIAGGTLFNTSSNNLGTLLQGPFGFLFTNRPFELDFQFVTNQIDDPRSPFYWGVIPNADGSVSFQSRLTGQFIDADSDGTSDLSEELLPDDSWFVVF